MLPGWWCITSYRATGCRSGIFGDGSIGTGSAAPCFISSARSIWPVEKVGERFGKRILLPDETAYCLSHKDPAPFVAARFAAKEAISKAFCTALGALQRTQGTSCRAKEYIPV